MDEFEDIQILRQRTPVYDESPYQHRTYKCRSDDLGLYELASSYNPDNIPRTKQLFKSRTKEECETPIYIWIISIFTVLLTILILYHLFIHV